MPTEEDIKAQQELLKVHRHTLMILLRRLSKVGGEAYAPPEVIHGIEEARSHIQEIKNFLRNTGLQIEDLPSDENNTPSFIRKGNYKKIILGIIYSVLFIIFLGSFIYFGYILVNKNFVKNVPEIKFTSTVQKTEVLPISQKTEIPTIVMTVTDNIVYQCRITQLTGAINLRSGPGSNFTILSRLEADEMFTVNAWSESKDGSGIPWFSIQSSNGTLGWVISRPYPDRGLEYECNFSVRPPFPFIRDDFPSN